LNNTAPGARAGETVAARNPVIRQMKQLIRERSVLQHPFYQAWQKGEVPMDALREYAGQYYPHVLAFPTYLSAVHANCPELSVRQQILENLIEEERGDKNHPELWLRFAEGLDMTRKEVFAKVPLPSTKELIDTFQSTTRNSSFPAGMAAMFAYESQIPKVSETKMDGLRAFYGVRDARSLEFFAAHMGLDEIHSQVAAGIIGKNAKTPALRREVLASATAAADAYWGFLDGVMDAYMG
jgi:pyrroloquinoline-quinone synthase